MTSWFHTNIINYFLRLRVYQHGPSRAFIEDHPTPTTARLTRDNNNSATFT